MKDAKEMIKDIYNIGFDAVIVQDLGVFSYIRENFPDLPIHAKLGITKRGNQYVYGKHDLFAVVIAFRYLLPSDAFLAFKQELSKEIDRFSKNCSSLSQSDLLSAMGFPSNWKNISRRYKLQL